MGVAVSFQNASKEFVGANKHTVKAVQDVTFDIEEGSIAAVIGYSGAGKSTLVRLINALEKPTGGKVVVNGHNVRELDEAGLRKLRSNVGMIFQQFNLFNSRTVAGNVAYPLKLAKWDKAKINERVAELLDFVGVGDKAKQYPNQLSGGQKQRVGIARALATSPKILLADESTSALDPETTRQVLNLLKQVNRELGITIVVITHEMDVVKYLANTVSVMEHGKLIEHGPVYDVFSHPQGTATKRFIRSALNDKPNAETVTRLSQKFPGRIISLQILEEGGARSTIAQAERDGKLRGRVIYGAIDEIEDRPFGNLTYQLKGEDAEIDQVLASLRKVTTVEEWKFDSNGIALPIDEFDVSVKDESSREVVKTELQDAQKTIAEGEAK